jgi:hypothetical protein
MRTISTALKLACYDDKPGMDPPRKTVDAIQNVSTTNMRRVVGGK